MPNPDEAREEAWQQQQPWEHTAPPQPRRVLFNAGWDARGRYDEQRIAALIEALTASCYESDDWNAYCFFCHGEQEFEVEEVIYAYFDHKADCPWVEARLFIDVLHELRALGRSEEVKP